MTASSVINLTAGGNAKTLSFSNTSWTPGAFILAINNWTGTPWVGGTDDRIFFAGMAGGPILTDISFAGFVAGAGVLGSGEVVPVPEPSTILSGLLLMGLLARRVRQQVV